ncbi:MAG TPA: PAS domain S-box protein [Thermoanaerobaculia bacterium]|nr:PAS domain S-box protein [Thermoanaerobaculia bacterium]
MPVCDSVAELAATAGVDDPLFGLACSEAAVGMCLLAPDGRFLRVNRAFCDLVGCSEAELLETGFAPLTHPDDLERSLDLQRRLLEGELASATIEKRYLHRTGRVVWVQLTVAVVGEPGTGGPRYFISQMVDITARREMEEALHRSEERFRLLADTSSDMISRHTLEGRYLYVSPACRHLLGYEPEELVGRSAYDFLHPDDLETIRAAHETILERSTVYTISYRIRHRDGHHLWFETSSRVVPAGEPGAGAEIHASSRDVTERKLAESRIRELARHLEEANRRLRQANLVLKELAATDPLTGVANRRELDERLVLELHRAARAEAPLSLLFLDMDRFKEYNDRFGHPAGDELLVRLGGMLTRSMRTSDAVARFGGEEFVILLPDTDEAGARILGDKLRSMIASKLAARAPITASLGVATSHPDSDRQTDFHTEARRLLSDADRALYESKRAGRNRVTHAADLAPCG